MKTVVEQCDPTPVVSLSDVSSSKYYGCSNRHVKGFVARQNIDSNSKYVVLCSDNFTYGNGWRHLADNLFQGVIQNIIDSGMTVYEFDTSAELFEWLAE